MDGYIRVSAKNGRSGASYISPREQRGALEQGAKLYGVTLDEVVIEEDVSGAKRADERGLEALLAKVERGESDGILVAKIDRLSRGSLLDTAAVFERLDKAGARLIAVRDGADSHAPGGEMLLGMHAVMARSQWRSFQENWKTARAAAVKRGAYIGRAPYGYDKDEHGVLRPNEQAPVVREMFALRAAGRSFTEIGAALAMVPPPASDGELGNWMAQTVKQILRNPAYAGEARHGQYRNPAAHEPIVSRADFEAVQVARRVQTPKPGASSAKTLLPGVARCDGCGRTLKVLAARSGTSYYCKNPSSKGVCPARAYARSEPLDELVEKCALALLRGRVKAAKASKADGPLLAAEKELADAEAALHLFVTEAVISDPAVFNAGVESREARVERAKAARAGLAAKAAISGPAPQGDLIAAWENGELTVHERRRAIALLWDRVVVRKGRGPLADRVTLLDGTVGVAPSELGMALA